MALHNVHPYGMQFSQCTDTAWQLGEIRIERRHFLGYPYRSEFFVYLVTASWSALCELGITNGVSLPEGRKRINSGGSIADGDSWSVRAIKGSRWVLWLRVDSCIPSIEALIAGRPVDPDHVPWKGTTDMHREARQIGKARRDTAFQAFKARLLESAE